VDVSQGDIVWVAVADRAGKNPKCRPAVVVTPDDEIEEDGNVVVVAATSSFTKPLPDNVVELPWHRGRHPVTGLYVPCVVICDWLTEVSVSDIVNVGGRVPGAHLARILARVPE
jgi:mRNA-degrading endonuclease toxin of MazEF toxin-antitoxin module